VLWTKLQVKQSSVASLSAYARSLIAISKLNTMHHASCGKIHDECLAQLHLFYMISITFSSIMKIIYKKQTYKGFAYLF